MGQVPPGRSRWAARLLLVVATAAWMIVPAVIQAGPTYQVPIGPRALAMGGAFSAVADDASAGYWNPAGLPLVGHQEISATHADLFGTGITDSYLSFVLPLSPRDAASLDYYNSGFDDGELGFHENRVQLSFGSRFHPRVAGGLSLKYLSRDTDLDGVTVRQGDGFGVDLGVLAFPHDAVRVALSLQDATDTRLQYRGDDGSAVAFPRNLRGGVAVRPVRDLTLAFDVDDRWHSGLEYRLRDALALRGGLQKDWQSTDGLVWSAGAGLKVGVLRFDYARVDQPSLGATNHFGASLEFNFNPAQVRIEKADASDVYVSLFKSYARDPVGTLQLRNLDSEPIHARVSYFVPELMNVPTEQDVILRPKATQDVTLTAVMSEKALQQQDDRPVQASVAVTYQSARLLRTERRTTHFIAYGPGAIDWSGGVEQAAAFVTARDPVVDAFAADAIRGAAAARTLPPFCRDLANTVAIVDALGALGVTYVPDPKNPYSTMSATPRAVDTIAYPRETLVRRAGDCDDTTVLIAALLGSVGIGSQFVDVPGHLFLLADTGVHERQRLALGLEAERFVVADERLWVPIETTALNRGFTEAWQAGLEAYASRSGRGRLSRVDVAEAAGRYEPAQPAGAAVNVPALDPAKLDARVRSDVGVLDSWRAAFLAKLESEAGEGPPITEEALNDVAHVYYGAGQYESAERTLERALAIAPGASRTLNNLGTVRAAQGRWDEAADLYLSATGQDPSIGGAWLNLGLAQYAMGDRSAAGQSMAIGLERSGGYAAACELLGLPAEVPEARGSEARMTEAEVRMLLEAAMRKVPASPQRPDPNRPAPADSLPPGRKWVGGRGGARAEDVAGGHLSLYWR